MSRRVNSNVGCKGLDDDELQRTADVFRDTGFNISETGRILGIGHAGAAKRLDRCRRLGYLTEKAAAADDSDLRVRLMALLRQGRHTEAELAEQIGVSRGTIADEVDAIRAAAINIADFGGRLTVERVADITTDHGADHSFTSDRNKFKFGWISDTHMGSKYARIDVAEALYDVFAEEGITRVFHAGNWIDGEARFNKYDLLVHGMDAQCRYLAEHYPQRPGIVTYAIAGDDHEGWYAQREGVDIGRYAQNRFRDAGRQDWIDLGYMESYVPLVNAESGEASQMLVSHPGGGSAYALSYAIQKIVESLDGGEKPAVGLWGHYHKLWFGNIRNVWCIQTGCCQDQTPFGRKKKLDFQVGGGTAELTQDPKTGAIVRCKVEILRFFNKGYYQGRWSLSGDVTLPERLQA